MDHARYRDGRTARALAAGLICVLAVLLLAGCLGTFQGSQEGPLTLNLSNGADSERTFEVYLGERPIENVTVHQRDGRSYTTSTGTAGLSTNGPGEGPGWRSIEMPPEATAYGEFRLAPNETNEMDIVEEELPSKPVVVVVIHDDENVTSWVSSTCSGDFVYLEVLATEYGSSSAYNC